jgi:hypothetical protein
VVLVVLDGPRMSESFEELDHPHIPLIWNQLRPAGCLLSEFRNEGSTYTLRGHGSILTGTWQHIANDGTQHPTQPTIFEYYRAAYDVPPDDVWLVSGKWRVGALTYSDHPAYGPLFAASSSNVDRSDLETYEDFKQRLAAHHPTLSMLSLSEMDIHGHYLRWSEYLAAIIRADSLVHDLWTLIEADPVYSGRTALIVTCDHGRHLDDSGGYQNHGDGCLGCQRLGFIALGPEFARGLESPTLRLQLDIATTVAHLLSFPTPYSEGNLIEEIFASGSPVGDEPAPSTGPARFGLALTPNPFALVLRVAVRPSGGRPVAAEVIDALGRHVRTIGLAGPGGGFLWDGRLDDGSRAPSGLYLVVARRGHERAVEKAFLLR